MIEPIQDQEYQQFLDWKRNQAAETEAAQPKPQMYYAHLADGRVEVLGEDEAGQSHYDGVRIIDKYAVGE